MERTVFDKLLFETIETALKSRPPSTSSTATIVVMDRGGLGDAARQAPGLLALFAAHFQASAGTSKLVHVSFNTPHGIGILVRNAVAKSAAEHAVDAMVSIADQDAEWIDKVALDSLLALLRDTSSVISHAASASFSLLPQRRLFAPDPLLARSHGVVLSFLDPEALLGEAARFASLIGPSADFAAIRFRIQIYRGGKTEEIGTVELVPSRLKETVHTLSRLIEAARRHVWFAAVEPIEQHAAEDPAADTAGLFCPCRELLHNLDFLPSVKAVKTIPSGACATLVARGIDTEGLES